MWRSLFYFSFKQFSWNCFLFRYFFPRGFFAKSFSGGDFFPSTMMCSPLYFSTLFPRCIKMQNSETCLTKLPQILNKEVGGSHIQKKIIKKFLPLQYGCLWAGPPLLVSWSGSIYTSNWSRLQGHNYGKESSGNPCLHHGYKKISGETLCYLKIHEIRLFLIACHNIFEGL